jgi:two-component sensor histidine kinase
MIGRKEQGLGRWLTPALARLAYLLPVVSVLVPFSLLLIVGWLTWVSTWKSAEGEMRRAAISAAEYGQRAFEGYIQSTDRVNDLLRGLTDAEIRANEAGLHRDLQMIIRAFTQIELSYVIDRDGHPLLSSGLYPIPADRSLAQREYFQVLSGDDPPDVHISKTFIGRFDGRLLFSVSRRRAVSDEALNGDAFRGVVLVSVRPEVLADGLERLLEAPNDRMAFMRSDGYGISTTSGIPIEGQPLPKVDPSSPFYKFAGSGAQSAVYISRTAMPGSEALLAMEALQGLPIYAVSMRSRSEIVAAWRAEMLPLLAFGGPAILALFLLSLKVWRDHQRLIARNAFLLEDINLSTSRLIRAKRFGLVGTFEFDISSGISRRTAEYMSIQGLAAAPALETHDDWADRLHPDDRSIAEREVARVLSDESGETEYGQTYRIITPTGEIRWIAARGEIERDEAGHAVVLRGAHVDVTPLRTAEMALAESDARLRLAQESMGIGAWECVHFSEPMTFSSKALDLFGIDAGTPCSASSLILSRIDPLDRAAVRQALRNLRSTGAFQIDLRLKMEVGADSRDRRWIAIRAKKHALTDTGPARCIGTVHDISARKAAEQLTVVMAHEVEHRAKNVLTVISSLLRNTRADTVDQFAHIMNGRVHALSQTMSLLGSRQWKGADLGELLRNELETFGASKADFGTRIILEGPAVTISPDAAQPLAMTLHEMATNAAKYGSLSSPEGRVTVTWSKNAENVSLKWVERGGPRLQSKPSQKGFGSQLMALLFEGQLGGTMLQTWQEDGLAYEMTFSTASPEPPPELTRRDERRHMRTEVG